MELRRYLKIISAGWWLILLAILVSLGSAWFITSRLTPVYHTEATFVVSPSASLGSVSEVFRGADQLAKREGIMATYVAIATSNTIASSVYDRMELTEAQRKHMNVGSEMLPSTNIIKVTAEAYDPVVAKICADLVGQETVAYVKTLYEIYDIKSLDPAYVPEEPSNISVLRNLIIAALLGSVVGVGSAFLLYYLRLSGEEIVGITVIDLETGVYSWPYFLQRLGEELSRARRHRHPLSMALMSIDRLDMIGDSRANLRVEALRRVGLFLKQYLREEDILARQEGDRFALLFPDTSGPDAEQKLQTLHTRMEWTVFELDEGSVKLNLTATSGIVAYPSDDANGISREQLLAHAERTLRQATDEGHGKVHLFDGQQHEQ